MSTSFTAIFYSAFVIWAAFSSVAAQTSISIDGAETPLGQRPPILLTQGIDLDSLIREGGQQLERELREQRREQSHQEKEERRRQKTEQRRQERGQDPGANKTAASDASTALRATGTASRFLGKWQGQYQCEESFGSGEIELEVYEQDGEIRANSQTTRRNKTNTLPHLALAGPQSRRPETRCRDLADYPGDS